MQSRSSPVRKACSSCMRHHTEKIVQPIMNHASIELNTIADAHSMAITDLAAAGRGSASGTHRPLASSRSASTVCRMTTFATLQGCSRTHVQHDSLARPHPLLFFGDRIVAHMRSSCSSHLAGKTDRKHQQLHQKSSPDILKTKYIGFIKKVQAQSENRSMTKAGKTTRIEAHAPTNE